MGKKDKLEGYEMVKDRLKRYGQEYDDFRVTTEIISPLDNLDDVIVKAYIYKNKEDMEAGLHHSTGVAEELRDAGFINKTSHVENAETSAIGRALANINYHGTDKRPSKEEMDKVKRTKKAKDETKKEKEKSEPSKSYDEVVEEIKGFDTVDEVVTYFNEQVGEREGKDKDKFQKEVGPVANKKVQSIKENG